MMPACARTTSYDMSYRINDWKVHCAMQGLNFRSSIKVDNNCLHGWPANLTGLLIYEMKSFQGAGLRACHSGNAID
eukprot:scaffold17126_cov17-Prasinocladus_malaysianus.AAC.1